MKFEKISMEKVPESLTKREARNFSTYFLHKLHKQAFLHSQISKTILRKKRNKIDMDVTEKGLWFMIGILATIIVLAALLLITGGVFHAAAPSI